MDDRRYERLIGDLEAQATINPGAYRLKAVLVSLSAYIVLALALVLLAVAFYFLVSLLWSQRSVMVKLYIVLGAFPLISVIYVAIRALCMRLDAAPGFELTEAEAPKLFQLLEKIRKKVDGPPIDRVVITPEYNAAIQQLPRFGFFGGYQNHLIIGLPLAYSLSGSELAGVIAHEYGHLSGSHGKLSSWIYRQRRTFGALMDHAGGRVEDNWLHQALYAALEKFAPYYNAITFVLSRQNEYEADAAAASVVGSQRFISALTRTDLLGGWLSDSFWPKLYQQANERDKPAFMPFSAMPTAFKAGFDEWNTADRLKAAWKVDSGLLDTHPCLRERVEAQGGQCLPPAAIRASAADTYLGTLAGELAKRMDKDWWDRERPGWQSHYRKTQRDAIRLQELDAQHWPDLPAHDLQEYALLLADADQSDKAKEVLRNLLARRDESYPKPTLLYGQLLLAEGNAAGLQYLEQAIALSPALAEDCIRIGCQWLYQHQSEAAADDWYAKIMEQLDDESS